MTFKVLVFFVYVAVVASYVEANKVGDRPNSSGNCISVPGNDNEFEKELKILAEAWKGLRDMFWRFILSGQFEIGMKLDEAVRLTEIDVHKKVILHYYKIVMENKNKTVGSSFVDVENGDKEFEKQLQMVGTAWLQLKKFWELIRKGHRVAAFGVDKAVRDVESTAHVQVMNHINISNIGENKLKKPYLLPNGGKKSCFLLSSFESRYEKQLKMIAEAWKGFAKKFWELVLAGKLLEASEEDAKVRSVETEAHNQVLTLYVENSTENVIGKTNKSGRSVKYVSCSTRGSVDKEFEEPLKKIDEAWKTYLSSFWELVMINSTVIAFLEEKFAKQAEMAAHTEVLLKRVNVARALHSNNKPSNNIN